MKTMIWEAGISTNLESPFVLWLNVGAINSSGCLQMLILLMLQSVHDVF